LAVPAAASILTGFIPVVRSHGFTFFSLAGDVGFVWKNCGVARAGGGCPAFTDPCRNKSSWRLRHRVGSGISSIVLSPGLRDTNRFVLAFTAAACAAVTLINPYGFGLLALLDPGVAAPARAIAEFRRRRCWPWDDFLGIPACICSGAHRRSCRMAAGFRV